MPVCIHLVYLSFILTCTQSIANEQQTRALKPIDPSEAKYGQAEPVQPSLPSVLDQQPGTVRRTLSNPNPSGLTEDMIPEFGKQLPQVPQKLPSYNGPGWAGGPVSQPPADHTPEEKRIGRLEQMAFGNTYPEHEVEDRLDHLETEVFGNKNRTLPVDQRIGALESKLGAKSAFGNTPGPIAARPGVPGFIPVSQPGFVPQGYGGSATAPPTVPGAGPQQQVPATFPLPQRSQAFVPPARGTAFMPQQSAVPPPLNQAPQQSRAFVPSSAFPPQQAGAFPPQQAGAFPPQQAGALPPQQAGALPPQQAGALPPQQAGALPPQQAGGFPPQQAGGFPPQQAGAFPPQQAGGFPPQQAGAFPPQQAGAFPPQQAGAFPPQQAGAFPPQQFPSQQFPPQQFPPQQASGFPPQQASGFPPQQASGFPPQQASGFPPQQASGFPPQQASGFPPQQASGFPPQQASGFPPQQASGFPPQQASGFPPQQASGFPPQQASRFPPQQTGALPRQSPPSMGQADQSPTEAVIRAIPERKDAGDYLGQITRFDKGCARWTNFPVLVHLPGNTPDNWQKILEGSVSKWNQYIPVRVASASEPADVEIAWINHLPPRQLGLTNLEVFSGRMRVTVYLLRPTYYLANTSEKVLANVALHEIGHALGLFGHSTDPMDVMFPVEAATGKDQTKVRSTAISQRDLNTLKKVYQSPPLPSGYQTPHPYGWSYQDRCVSEPSR